MQEFHQPNSDLESECPRTEAHASKKRKRGERVVVAVKLKENHNKQHKSEGPPLDCWSWRKYGQKTIKGSPYPRGYYRCSTRKGCSAKKHVERCNTDSSILLITYTSIHNHPGPDFSAPNDEKQEMEEIGVDSVSQGTDTPTSTTKQEQESAMVMTQETHVHKSEAHFHYMESPLNPTVDQEDGHLQENLETLTAEDVTEDPMELVSSLAVKSEENDFYDELEELPTSSFVTAFMRRSFREERIMTNPI